MFSLKASLLALLVTYAYAAPQLGALSALADDDIDEPFNDNPQYAYSYQVADDNEQTYIAHQESRDGVDVTGEYSYVDPLGNLIVVRYTAGVMGYTETREVQPNFVQIRRRTSQVATAPAAPAVVAPTPAAPVRQVVQQIRPVVQQVVQETSSSSSASGGNDDDLVARIISQLTPFIRNTVSTSLTGGSSSGSSSSNSGSSQTTTTTTTTASRRPASATSDRTSVRRVVAVPVQAAAPVVSRETITTTSTSADNGNIQNIFGVQGENNVRVNTPDFNFAYDLTQ